MSGVENILKEVVGITQDLQGYLGDTSGGTVASVKAVMKEHVDTTGKANSVVCGYKDRVQDALWRTIELLGEMSLWISLQVPMIEDGNNFGVEVQGYAIKKIQEAKKELKTLADGLKDYHSQRVAALKDVCSKETTTVKKVESNSQSETTGGEKPGKQGKTANDNDTTITSVTDRVLADALELVLAIDVHWFFHLRMVASQSLETLQVVSDVVEKNKGKILKPKGSRPMY